jgi:hypothetical protein
MMLHYVRTVIAGIAVCAVVGASQTSARAGLIATLSLGGDAGIDVEFDGTVLSTDGPQNTEVEFSGILDSVADIPTATASFTLEGLTESGPALVIGTQVIQQFTGGTFSLYHPDSTLLLSGSLLSPALTGTIGLPGGMLFTSSFSTVTGGTLAGYLDPNSVILQMHLSNINGGAGLSEPSTGELDPFTAAATADIEADSIPVPEPTTGMLVALCGALGVLASRRRRS